MSITPRVVGVHALVEWECPRCGGPSVALSVCPLQGSTIVPMPHAGGPQICVDCRTADRHREEAECTRRRKLKTHKLKLTQEPRP